MQNEFAQRFTRDWLEAWNAHDLARILAHYAEDFEMHSPIIAQLMGQPSGSLRGKTAVGEYWAKALTLFPSLHFEMICMLVGTNSVVIHYHGATGKKVAEVFEFGADGLVIRARAHYEL